MENRLDKIINYSELSEKAIEKFLCKIVDKFGGICLKYSNQDMTGYPDRVVLLPCGVTIWFELKSKGKKLRLLQQIRIKQMQEANHIVFVCDSKEQIVEALYKTASNTIHDKTIKTDLHPLLKIISGLINEYNNYIAK